MKAGTQERGKVIVLAVLAVVAGVLLYQQFLSGPSSPAAAVPSRSRPTAADRKARSAADIVNNRAAQKVRSAARVNNDFKPSLKRYKPGEGPDPNQADPTLRLDLLAAVQAVDYDGVERNLFQFGPAKPKLTPQQVADAKKEAAAAAAKLVESKAADPKPGPPPKPKAPPVNMKYFGYANRPGDIHKRAFLMDGDDILVASEGEVLKKRYKVVRIGINSLVVEDIQFHSEQTLPLEETKS